MRFSGKSQISERVLSGDPAKVFTMTTTSPQGRTELLRPDGSPVRVLVVDDELSITELLSMALRYEGWQIRVRETARVPSRPRGSSVPTPSSWT